MANQVKANEKQNKFTSYLQWSDEGKSSLVRYIIGLFIILVFFFLLGGLGALPIKLIHSNIDDSLIWKNLFTLSVFIIPFIFIPLITKWVHKRPKWSVALAKPRIEKWNFAVGFIIALLVGILTLLIFGAIGSIKLDFVGFNWSTWIPLLVIGLIGIFIQTSTEEMLFRGYITQFTRRFSKNVYVFLFMPALLFALPHIGNISALGGGILVLVPYLVSGLLYGWVAYRTGSLWMSVGLHFNNNLGGLVLFGVSGDVLKTVAPVQFPSPSLSLTTWITIIQAVLTVLAIQILLKRRESKTQVAET